MACRGKGVLGRDFSKYLLNNDAPGGPNRTQNLRVARGTPRPADGINIARSHILCSTQGRSYKAILDWAMNDSIFLSSICFGIPPRTDSTPILQTRRSA